MYLTEANLLHYLAERGFASFGCVVDGKYSVRSLGRRNSVLQVNSGSAQYTVKQPSRWDSDSRATVEREAAFYWQVQNDPRFASIAKLLPACFAWDPQNTALIFEFLPRRLEVHRSPHRFETGVASRLGTELGALHGLQIDDLAAAYPLDVPCFFEMHRMDENHLAQPSGGRSELVAAIRKHPEFARALDHLRPTWRSETFIHGDWKLENCLLAEDGDGLHVVDWELAGWGDARWDLATLLQSYWNFHVRWPSEFALELIRPALWAALRAYARARRLDEREIAWRALPFAGVRMLQSAFELLDDEPHLNASAVRLLQASSNILSQPEFAYNELFGAPWNSTTN